MMSVTNTKCPSLKEVNILFLDVKTKQKKSNNQNVDQNQKFYSYEQLTCHKFVEG